MKERRLELIREIIRHEIIETQDELAAELRKKRIAVTQATVSRDIREMHLLKVLAEDGSYRYATMEKSDAGMNDRLIRMLADSVVEMNCANNLIVIHTLPGSAHVAAEAIDNLKWPETIGTIAGDNTILVIIKNIEDVDDIIGRFHEMIGNRK